MGKEARRLDAEDPDWRAKRDAALTATQAAAMSILAAANPVKPTTAEEAVASLLECIQTVRLTLTAPILVKGRWVRWRYWLYRLVIFQDGEWYFSSMGRRRKKLRWYHKKAIIAVCELMEEEYAKLAIKRRRRGPGST